MRVCEHLRGSPRLIVRRFAILLLFLCVAIEPSAAADGGAVFDDECADCHSVAKPMKHKKGPSLVGIFGRKAATYDWDKYSDALKTSGLVWTAENLDAYIKAPKSVVAGGGTMKYDGLANPADRAA